MPIKYTHELDESGALATISFVGLGLFCVNKQNRCEMRLLSCERHKPFIDIQRIILGGDYKPDCGSKVHQTLDLRHDLWIEVVNPQEPGVLAYINEDIGFERAADRGHRQDFRWIVDLEGPEFHNEKLSVKCRQVGIDQQSMVFLNAGTFYTANVSCELFRRVTIKNDPKVNPFLGRLGFNLGAAITCLDQNDSKIVISNKVPCGDSVELPMLPRVKYKIIINNICSPLNDLTRDERDSDSGSDFRCFYKVVTDKDGTQFDLQQVVGHSPDNLTLDSFPDVCMDGFLSLTDSLH